MSVSNKGLVLALVALCGLWGCARGPADVAGRAERIRALEGKITKLEDDFRAAAAARDAGRQKLVSVEQQLTKEIDQLRVVVRERDDLRKQLVTRTSERDAVQGQYEQFRKGIRDLLGQADAALGTPAGQPVTAATAPGNPGKS